MNAVRIILALAVSAVLAAGAWAGPQGAPNKGKRHHAVRGVVVAVQTADAKEKGTDLGSITVKAHRHKKNAAATEAAPVEKTFQVDANTTFEKVVVVGKGQRTTGPAKFADIQKGERVAVVATNEREHRALKVQIIVRRKKGAFAR